MQTSETSYRCETIRSVAVVGTGLIGASWAAYFLGRGLDVNASDAHPEGESKLRRFVEAALPDVLATAAIARPTTGKLRFSPSIAEAVAGCDFVQENVVETIGVKRSVIAEIDHTASPDVIIASSTSSLRTTDIQADCAHPDRVLVAHPFNPPHLIPLVEIVKGGSTADAAQHAAFRFYERIGKSPILVRKELVGHVANRMTAALWQEAVHLVAEGVATVEDVDKAIREGPGLRWAIHGPHMLYHLGGGEGGIEAYLEHLGPAQAARWHDLGRPTLDGETKAKLIAGVLDEARGRSVRELSADRDAALLAVLAARARPSDRRS